MKLKRLPPLDIIPLLAALYFSGAQTSGTVLPSKPRVITLRAR